MLASFVIIGIISESMIGYWRELRKIYLKAGKIHVILDQGHYNTSKETKKGEKQQ